MSEREYTVSVSCKFDADSPEDAVIQMVLWIEEAARNAGYRWESPNETGFIDADNIDSLVHQDYPLTGLS